MTQGDFKKLLEESLKPVREEQIDLRKITKEIQKEQTELRRIIEERVLPPVIYVETTIKSYADRYVANEDHIRRLDKRLNTVEENLGIQPPEELTIPVID